MSREPEIGDLDLESETPCCIQLGGEKCSRHGPAVERPTPEGCAGCAARNEKLRALAAQVEHFVSLMEGVELDYRLHGHLADLHVVASMLLLPASPKESRRHE